MANRTCRFCTKIFDFPYLLDRHLNSRRGCPMKVFESDSPAYARDVDEDIKRHQKSPNDTKNHQMTPKITNDHQKTSNHSDYGDIDYNTNDNNILQDVRTKNIGFTFENNKWKCLLCQKYFSYRRSAYRHVNSLRCKEINIPHIETIVKRYINNTTYK